MKAITVEQITKTYHHKKVVTEALKGISFAVEQGEIFGVIGPDGAGKTSLFRILTTLLLADSGTASVDGFDVVKDYKKIRNCVGYMPGRFSLYPDLTVQENLEFFAAIFNTTIKENYDLIKDIYQQIEPFKDRRAGQLSGGMKQKLALSCALIHKPTVLFLDEPTTGVDAVSRKEFWEMLHRLKIEGITVLVSTAYMDEATLCDRVALIQNGKLLSVSTPQGIVSEYPNSLWAIRANEMYPLLQAIKADPGIESIYPFGQYHHVAFKTPDLNRQKLEQIVKNGQYTGVEIKTITPNIEDCFMALMS
ncbi:ABC transporter related protein [Pseudopedobacter saltans DSM 12145]|uniref:ABC transporter related protein n=1 Tax=Pseudopedobacter saltans (strain ATCC 51119 / DSM 12145 / JCM 21818 / CCUG 39354 / LMG 10337 / NBRC 100064 / NCIMB 13643) TaxID=762903 RepID=F0SCZ1_PSESL|nr:ABC transporter ATP-binding protein [Pseudopedobacter saltans]ADY51748.1 ABC transporter related protein [Pseudopedobacter saltans DSM 12145]